MKAARRAYEAPPSITSAGGSFIGAREGYASVPPQAPKGMSGTSKAFEAIRRATCKRVSPAATPAQHEARQS